jgi:transcriptional regulator with XRE-family HTH domain
MRGTKKPAPTPREIFGKNVKRARTLRELSQDDLALDAGLSRSYIGGVERGARNIGIDNMGLIAAALRITLKELVDPDRFRDPLDGNG